MRPTAESRKRVTAFHEAGHAIAYCLNGVDIAHILLVKVVAESEYEWQACVHPKQTTVAEPTRVLAFLAGPLAEFRCRANDLMGCTVQLQPHSDVQKWLRGLTQLDDVFDSVLLTVIDSSNEFREITIDDVNGTIGDLLAVEASLAKPDAIHLARNAFDWINNDSHWSRIENLATQILKRVPERWTVAQFKERFPMHQQHFRIPSASDRQIDVIVHDGLMLT
jgi:hypothetical protein